MVAPCAPRSRIIRPLIEELRPMPSKEWVSEKLADSI